MFRNFLPEDSEKLKIGLLGGSFNPPHQGHLAITLAVKKKFNLKRVFWLVTPCSPAKEAKDYLALDQRIELCKELVLPHSSIIKVLDCERGARNYYSYNLVKQIKTNYCKTKFFWIIGGDNFLSLDQWFRWKDLCREIQIIICERGRTALQARRSKVGKFFPFIGEGQEGQGFSLVEQPRLDISSSEIRKKLW
jgi:nicotinate-nucleotide adenylyltransferase